jgi:general secretion pathway protein B
MSFILDALRKSDNERREHTAPTLAAAPQAVAIQKRTIWLPILAVVLTVNALVFGTIFLTRDEPMPVAATTLPPVEPEVRSLRKETLVDSAAEQPSNTPAGKMPSSEPAITPAPAAPVSTTPVVASKPTPASSPTIQEGLPSLGQLQAAGLVSTPNLRVDMHVYSGDATKRFVFINMTKYREGDRLPEGPTIEEITPEGLIMVQQGNRFSLDRD